MKYLFELSKEHKTIPRSEIYTCLDAEKINYKIVESNKDVLIIDTSSKIDKILKLSNRLSFTYYIDSFLFYAKPTREEITKKSRENLVDKKGNIAIKYKNRSRKINSQTVVKPLASVYSENREVKLDNPDIEIRAVITDEKVYVGIKIVEINRKIFENRKVQFRPFFSPISLHPKIALSLVNLSRVKKDEILLDPFCGTGGILVEAGLIGVKIVGSDIEEKMVDGCKKTLDFYKIKNYKLFCVDIGEIREHINGVDAVVTDLPYGRSTTTKKEKIEDLYRRSFKHISEVLKPGGRAVIGISDEKLVALAKGYLDFVETHEFRVHKSLTRYFVVFEKK